MKKLGKILIVLPLVLLLGACRRGGRGTEVSLEDFQAAVDKLPEKHYSTATMTYNFKQTVELNTGQVVKDEDRKTYTFTYSEESDSFEMDNEEPMPLSAAVFTLHGKDVSSQFGLDSLSSYATVKFYVNPLKVTVSADAELLSINEKMNETIRFDNYGYVTSGDASIKITVDPSAASSSEYKSEEIAMDFTVSYK